MSKRSKFIVSATLIVLLLPIIIFFSIESYFPLAPYIDTRFSKDFDIDKFEKIEVGTSIDDVRLLIGEPIWKEGCGGCWETQFYTHHNVFEYPESRTCNEDCQAEDQLWQYTDDGACEWWDFAWKYYALNFHQGKVTEKLAQWHGD